MPHSCRFVFQAVHMLMAVGSSAQLGYGQAWQPGERRVSRLVFIGRNLNREELTEGFKACL
jgi:G3E family GTPase